MEGYYFKLQRYSTHDGPGIRTTVFLMGCPLNCLWCHNPESRFARVARLREADKCVSCGACARVCPQGGFDPGRCTLCRACLRACPRGALDLAGERVGAEELMRLALRDELFFDESGGGVTFSGGEPLYQGEFLLELLKIARRRGVHTTVDTSGYAPPALVAQAERLTDLFLYDVKAVDPLLHRRLTGVDNALILANLDDLARSGARLWLRLPLMPGLNDGVDNLRATFALAAKTRSERLHILPYHAAGNAKYARLGRDCPWVGAPPTADRLAEIAELARGYGLDVRIGG